METIGQRLEYARKVELRVSMREMERMLASLGVDATYVSVARYEHDERVPPADYVAAVAQLAGLSPGWLLAGEGAPRPAERGAAEKAVDEIAEIIRRAQRGE